MVLRLWLAQFREIRSIFMQSFFVSLCGCLPLLNVFNPSLHRLCQYDLTVTSIVYSLGFCGCFMVFFVWFYPDVLSKCIRRWRDSAKDRKLRWRWYFANSVGKLLSSTNRVYCSCVQHIGSKWTPEVVAFTLVLCQFGICLSEHSPQSNAIVIWWESFLM